MMFFLTSAYLRAAWCSGVSLYRSLLLTSALTNEKRVLLTNQRRVLPGPDQGLHHQDPVIRHGVAGALHVALRHVLPVSVSRMSGISGLWS